MNDLNIKLDRTSYIQELKRTTNIITYMKTMYENNYIV